MLITLLISCNGCKLDVKHVLLRLKDQYYRFQLLTYFSSRRHLNNRTTLPGDLAVSNFSSGIDCVGGDPPLKF